MLPRVSRLLLRSRGGFSIRNQTHRENVSRPFASLSEHIAKSKFMAAPNTKGGPSNKNIIFFMAKMKSDVRVTKSYALIPSHHTMKGGRGNR